MSAPQKIADKVYWSFFEYYDTKEEFEKDFIAYNKEMAEFSSSSKKIPFELDDIVFDEQKMVVQFILRDEREQYDKQILLETTNPEGFTMSEMMYQINNKTIKDNEEGYDLSEQDMHFFEGLEYLTDDDPDYPQTKVYFMVLGS